MKLMDKLKEFFGKSGKAPDSGNSKEQRQREADPEGTTRYERHIDKQMRKARTRA